MQAAASRGKFSENVTRLARRAQITNPSMDGEPLAALVRVSLRMGSSEHADGRVKCALDVSTRTTRASGAATWRKSACHPKPGHGRIHMAVGVIPVWGSCEAEKADWVRSNPWSNQAEYEAAMRSITEKTGV